jgi:hypothetical protein
MKFISEEDIKRMKQTVGYGQQPTRCFATHSSTTSSTTSANKKVRIIFQLSIVELFYTSTF